MKVTIDEARVGKQPILKIDGIELANIVNGYTLHHDAGQPATLELRIAVRARTTRRYSGEPEQDGQWLRSPYIAQQSTTKP